MGVCNVGNTLAHTFNLQWTLLGKASDKQDSTTAASKKIDSMECGTFCVNKLAPGAVSISSDEVLGPCSSRRVLIPTLSTKVLLGTFHYTHFIVLSGLQQ